MTPPIAPTTVIRVLTKVKARIELGWTQGANARDANDRAVLASKSGRRQVCWCLHGALLKESVNRQATHSAIMLQAEAATQLNKAVDRRGYVPSTRTTLGGSLYVQYNDEPGRTPQEVIALVVDTIKHIEETGL